MVLVNVELVVEGVDVPAIEVVQWLRPTASLIIWMQGNGRGMRPMGGKRLVILDHVGNWQRHGLPDDDREWTLEGETKRERKKREDEIKAKQCQHCYAVFRPGPTHCPVCGESLSGDGRKIEIVEGELEEINVEAVRKENRVQQARARSLQDLIALGIRRGQKNPAAWAAFITAARDGGRKPKPHEFETAKKIERSLRHA
jgi:superfamily II DNA or RNA helicase